MEDQREQKSKTPVKYTIIQGLEKARAWCAFQERCYQDTRGKLWDWGIRGEQAEQIIAQLISEGFLNEERFAKAYAGGKFRIKKWGRRKIIQELKKKKISEPCIRRGLAVIDEDDYITTLRELLLKRRKEVKEKNPLKCRAKIISFLIGKGYEVELIQEVYSE